jgi:DNA primase large subunit
MEYVLIVEDYAKYPFLESFSKVAGKIQFMQLPLQRLLETTYGEKALEIAKNRIITSLTSEEKDTILDKDVQIKISDKIPNIIAFGIARMIVSCTTQYVIDKFANKEAERAIYLLNHEKPYIQSVVFAELNYNKDSKKIPLKDYISLNMIRYGNEYKLCNCDISHGSIIIQNSNLILKEKIKQKIMRKLPLDVKPDVKEIFKPVIQDIMKYTSSTFSSDLGEVTIENFPPCINNIINMIKKEENPTHFGRFALVSFCNKIGMSDTEILTLFQTVKDFEVSTSMYQVEHITGKKGGTTYAAPACAAMKTNNLCRSGTDPLCNRVKHPLGYYSSMQKRKQKPQKPL